MVKSIEARLVQTDITTHSDCLCEHGDQDEKDGEEEKGGVHYDENSIHAATTKRRYSVAGVTVRCSLDPPIPRVGRTHTSLMPVVPVGSQIFDLAFHPTSSVVYTGLLNGKVKAFTYDEQGVHSAAFELRISKRSCRGLALSPDGASLYAVGKNKTMQCVAITEYH
jgi:hypothetical protein